MIHIEQQALSKDLKEQIYNGFSRHAVETTGFNELFESVAFVATENGFLAGAVVVELFWGALHVKYVYVEENFRGQGLASRLMEKALTYGKKHQCPFAFVETMSFQALEFYQKIGFTLDFTRFGYAHETAFHYLQKKL